MVQKFLQGFLQGLVQNIVRWKKAVSSVVCVLQQHHHFLNDWQQPEQLILTGARQLKR